MGVEYYELLGVEPDASTSEIVTAYRERLKETHPDVSNASDAKERTKRLIEAKEVLTDETERARYDRLGHDRYVGREGPNGGSTTEAATRTDEGSNGDDTAGTTDPDDPSHGTRAEGAGHSRRSRGQESSRASRSGTVGGIDWDEWEDADWDDISDAVWEEVTSDADTRTESTGHTDTAAAGAGGFGTAAGAAGTGDTSRGTAAGASDNTETDTTASGGTAATGDDGDRSVSWYSGGDPSGSSRDSWSTGGANVAGEPWGNWTPGGSNDRYKQETVPPHRVLSPFQTGLVWAIAFLTYPVFALGSVFPMFGGVTRLLLAIVLVFIIALLIILPQLGVTVFGLWTVLSPVLLAHLGVSLLAVESVTIIGVAVGALALSALSWLLTRPPAL